MIAAACPICSAVGGICYAHRSGVPRLIEVPAYRDWLIALGADGTPPASSPAPPHDPPSGFAAMPCERRSLRWNCGGECTAWCSLNRGVAGIVDEQDCRECPDRRA